LEHEYKNPSIEEVEDALDIAILFINYTNKYLYPALVDFALHDKKMGYYDYPADTKTIIMRLDWRNCKLILDTPVKGADGLWKHVNEYVTAEHKDYDECLKIFLSLYNDIFH
jgi:hypothetical protein